VGVPRVPVPRVPESSVEWVSREFPVARVPRVPVQVGAAGCDSIVVLPGAAPQCTFTNDVAPDFIFFDGFEDSDAL
jgi:hypothetical protein